METTLDRPQTVPSQKPARAKHNPELRDKVKALYMTGYQPVKIQEVTGVKPAVIHAWAHRHKWTVTRSSFSQEVARAVDTVVTDAVQRKTEQIHSSVVSELESTVQTLTKTKHSKTLDHVGQRVSIIERAASAGQKLGLWGQEQATSQALTLLCLSSSDAVSQGLVKPIEVESTVQPDITVQSSTEQKPQQNQDVQVVPSTGTEQGS